MDRRNLKWITWAFALTTVAIVALMLTRTLQRSVYITLPPPTSSSASTPGEEVTEPLTVVEVTPKTVQWAIETLSRPGVYRRTVTVEQFWDGGSGSYSLTTAVRSGWQRTDRLMPDHRMRHTVTDGETVYIWYNSERQVFSAPAGNLTADHDQSIPTYEDILDLPPEAILAADYRELEGLRCIYVETQEGEYTVTYWVSVDSGLLVQSQRFLGEKQVYRMSALALDTNLPDESEFTLPDGTKLLGPTAREAEE